MTRAYFAQVFGTGCLLVGGGSVIYGLLWGTMLDVAAGVGVLLMIVAMITLPAMEQRLEAKTGKD